MFLDKPVRRLSRCMRVRRATSCAGRAYHVHGDHSRFAPAEKFSRNVIHPGQFLGRNSLKNGQFSVGVQHVWLPLSKGPSSCGSTWPSADEGRQKPLLPNVTARLEAARLTGQLASVQEQNAAILARLAPSAGNLKRSLCISNFQATVAGQLERCTSSTVK